MLDGPLHTNSEFRVETLDPPFMFVPRPRILNAPTKIGFGKRFTVPVSIPNNLQARKIQGIVYYLRSSYVPYC